MTALTTTNTSLAPRDFNAGQLRLIRDQLARDCNDAEFDLFLEQARRLGLDPFRKQIYAIVTNKSNPDKRQMVVVTGIDGYRVIAERCQNYRPGDVELETDQEAKDPKTNPAGIIRARYTAYKQDNLGVWNSVYGEAWWEEFVPLYVNEERGICEIARGKDNWRKMPRRMISKCAEADALRKGWPESFSGLYAQEEMDHQQVIDLTATEILDEHAKAQRQALLGGPSVMLQWHHNEPIKPEPIGKAPDRCFEFLEQIRKDGEESPRSALATLDWWQRVNQASLRQIWAHDKNAGLEIKRQAEAAQKKLREAADAAPASTEE